MLVAAARGWQSVRSCRATRGGHRTGRGAAIFTCLPELRWGGQSAPHLPHAILFRKFLLSYRYRPGRSRGHPRTAVSLQRDTRHFAQKNNAKPASRRPRTATRARAPPARPPHTTHSTDDLNRITRSGRPKTEAETRSRTATVEPRTLRTARTVARRGSRWQGPDATPDGEEQPRETTLAPAASPFPVRWCLPVHQNLTPSTEAIKRIEARTRFC